jgi:D-alanyl-D-alanine carboxypeptidase
VPKAQPPVPLDDWRLVLVNAANPLPEGYAVSMTQLSDGLQVDKRCYSDLQAMLDACTAAGLYPRLESAYRDREEQDLRIDGEIARLVEEGMSHAEAEQEALKTMAAAGCSEHHLGLAVDIADKDAQQWLQEHSWEYGFILRYPGDKTAETGYAYDPGHYRYVGREAAKEMWESGLCLEEYIQQYQ